MPLTGRKEERALIRHIFALAVSAVKVTKLFFGVTPLAVKKLGVDKHVFVHFRIVLATDGSRTSVDDSGKSRRLEGLAQFREALFMNDNG